MKLKINTPRNVSSEARVTELADGSLLYNQRTRNTGRHLSWSNDGGETWLQTLQNPALKVTQCNGCTITVLDKLDRPSNSVFFSVPSPGGRSNGLIYASNDGGKTWSNVIEVTKGNFAYSALIQLDPEHVGLIYETGKYQKIDFRVFSIQHLIRGDQ